MSKFTKYAIQAAFMKLLDERPLSRITVKDIVSVCGINHNTFYYHYADLPALIEELIMQEAQSIISRYHSIESVETALNAAVDFAEQNRRAILHVYNSVNRDIFEQYLWKVCDHVIRLYGESILEGRSIAREDMDVLALFYRCECFGLVSEWLHDGMRTDVRGRIHRFCQLHQGIAQTVLARLEEGCPGQDTRPLLTQKEAAEDFSAGREPGSVPALPERES